jgi:hypothetical protein
MITSILALLGGAFGGLLRLAPEVLKLWNAKQDNAHELEMTKLQMQIDQARSAQAIDAVHAQGEVAANTGEMAAYVEAIKGQSVMSGVKWIDAVNQSVRPFLTYWWMLLFTAFKIDQLMRVGLTWGDNDWLVLSAILSFWFVDRAIRINNGQVNGNVPNDPKSDRSAL